ncbi:hypothetical protein TNIN_235131 [Trichonephila inaurata madagascariensis]|uniref:Sushi domain-containing protein n=1 Tax=Trichonephila inaurata madagascariensis TaxID=2747483 RepID=A0A8X6YSG3_9ARAC|nr:hypothetical protein TNIN_235131 [Trichonephila inaurata madagascariensis]
MRCYCREGGQLTDKAEIKCEDTGQWSTFPRCTCPVPKLSNDILLKNCNAPRPEEKCFLECKEHLKLIGDYFVLCQINTKWSSMPKCYKRYVHHPI